MADELVAVDALETPSADDYGLIEEVARDTHERWIKRRRAAGWRHGPRWDDADKLDPRLIPYDELAGPDRQEWRVTAAETLRSVHDRGYRLQPPVDRGVATGSGDELTAALATLASPDPADLPWLLQLWRGREPERWSRDVTLYRLLAQRMLGLGEPLLAYDVIAEGAQHWPTDVRMRQLGALALARSGAIERAQAVLQPLYDEGRADEETVGLLARTHKDLWVRESDPTRQQAHLRAAAELYAEAYARYGGYWTGINAATMAVVQGERDRATGLAARVQDQCKVALDRLAGADRYWPLASLGEAALVRARWQEADDWYRQAAAVSGQRFGDLASTRRNARLLVDRLGGDYRSIDLAL